MTITELERVAELCEAENITLRQYIHQWKLSDEIFDEVIANEKRSQETPAPKLVRILETFPVDEPKSPECVEMRGKLYTISASRNGRIGIDEHGRFQGFLDHGEYELVDPSDTPKVRVGDRVQWRDKVYEVLSLAKAREGLVAAIAYPGGAVEIEVPAFTLILVSSDTPLG